MARRKAIRWVSLAALLLGSIVISFIFFARRTFYAIRLPCGEVFLMEDPQNAELQRLRHENGLDRIIAPYSGELLQLSALAAWTSQLFPPSSPFPAYPPWNARVILDEVRHSQTGAFCAQYALIFGQCRQSLGYPVRYVDLANKDLSDSHFVAEVYVPSQKKWVVFRSQKGTYCVDRAGHPLGALDLHQYAIGRRKGSVYESSVNVETPREFVQLFYNFRYYLRNNFVSEPVFAALEGRPHGRQMVFEPYRLRWLDANTKNVAESGRSFSSDAIGDFEFPVDLRRCVQLSCRSACEFERLRQMMATGKVYRITTTRATLDEVTRYDLIVNPEFRPLDEDADVALSR